MQKNLSINGASWEISPARGQQFPVGKEAGQ
jgi:hypothetical protein